MIAGIAAYAIVVAIAQPDFSAWAYVGPGVLAALAASGIGKLIGLRGAERRLHTTVAAIRAQWRAPTRVERAEIPCG